MTNHQPAPETKSAGPDHAALADSFDEFMSAFEAFREENDRRLRQIEARKSADVVTVEKVDRISDALDRQKQVLDSLALKRARPALGREDGLSVAALERKEAFESYMRSGDEQALRTLETKDMSYGSGPDGGYLVPDTIEAEIGRRLAAISPIRSIASVRQVSTAVLKKPFTVTGPVANYRQNAHWVMNRKTQGAIRKFKDIDGNYLWQPPAAPGGRAMLMGFPLVEAEDMPDIAPGETSIAFGDFQRGYLVVDRTGVRVLRDPYSAKPYVLFYITKRVGGGVQDFDAIKLLKFGTAGEP